MKAEVCRNESSLSTLVRRRQISHHGKMEHSSYKDQQLIVPYPKRLKLHLKSRCSWVLVISTCSPILSLTAKWFARKYSGSVKGIPQPSWACLNGTFLVPQAHIPALLFMESSGLEKTSKIVISKTSKITTSSRQPDPPSPITTPHPLGPRPHISQIPPGVGTPPLY